MKKWPSREQLVSGRHNIIYSPLVTRDRVILQIKFGIMKQFVKGLYGGCFEYIAQKFISINTEKIKSWNIDEP